MQSGGLTTSLRGFDQFLSSLPIESIASSSVLQKVGGSAHISSLLFEDWPLNVFPDLSDALDTGKDSVIFEFSSKGITPHHRKHVFLITEMEDARQFEYLEPFSMIDFNRVDGFFLGLGSPSMVDFGPHDEFGINGGTGYGFANRAWQYFLGAEYRMPLGKEREAHQDTVFEHVFTVPPTLAFGAEFHNQTSTDDDWRTQRSENAAYAFFAREDFREYYKAAGYSGYVALRLRRQNELRVEWRSDGYENRDQTVFYGRWGGNKVLPPNYPITQGRLNSIAVTYQIETAHEHSTWATNVFGDSVEFQQMQGMSSIYQIEFGHMPGADHGFNRYLLDDRSFVPITYWLGFDTRLRYESTTGDTVLQKMEFLGGPSSLPALLNRSMAGTGLLLLNTELRLNLTEFSRVFGSDLQFAFLNDFGYVSNATLHGLRFNNIIYNIGAAFGYASGIQLGVSMRTDIKATARAIVRLQRSF
jgi:hypothetical protein